MISPVVFFPRQYQMNQKTDTCSLCPKLEHLSPPQTPPQTLPSEVVLYTAVEVHGLPDTLLHLNP